MVEKARLIKIEDLAGASELLFDTYKNIFALCQGQNIIIESFEDDVEFNKMDALIELGLLQTFQILSCISDEKMSIITE